MKIPVTVVTGFLGAGKTTLIRHLLETANGKRLALVINEFGDLGIDRAIIEGCGIKDCTEDDVIELTNGCICCTVADDFLPAMEKLLNRPNPPDHIVIETSGLALPKPLVQAFNWPEVRARVTVDGVVAVIDAGAVKEGRFAEDTETTSHDSPLTELFEDQLRCADLVILNKTDLLSGDGMETVKREIAPHLGAGVKVLGAVEGKVDGRVVLGMGAATEDVIEDRRSHHDDEEDHDHDEFESFVVELGAVSDPASVEARIKQVAADHDVLRIKGFLAVPGKDRRHLVQAVGGRVTRHYDRPWRDGESRLSALVVIGHAGLDREAIRQTLSLSALQGGEAGARVAGG
jgi:cobalamin biosynthesis protein CobW